MTASLWLRPNPVEFLRALLTLADTRGRAVKCVGLRPLACWHCGFESRRGYGCLVFFFLLLLCSVRQRSLRRAGLSSRGILPASVVCLSVIPKPQQWGCLGLRRYLDTFAKLRTTTFSFVMFVRLSVCPSVRPSVSMHGTTRLPLDEYLWNFISWVFFENLSMCNFH